MTRHTAAHGVGGLLLAVALIGCSESRQRPPDPGEADGAPPGADPPIVVAPPPDPPLPDDVLGPCLGPVVLADVGAAGVRLVGGGDTAVLQRLSPWDRVAFDGDGAECFPAPPMRFRGCDTPAALGGVSDLGPDGMIYTPLVAGDGTPWFEVTAYARPNAIAREIEDEVITPEHLYEERFGARVLRLPGGAAAVLGHEGERSSLERFTSDDTRAYALSATAIDLVLGRAGRPTLFLVTEAATDERFLATIDPDGDWRELAGPFEVHGNVDFDSPWHCVEDRPGEARYLRVDDTRGAPRVTFRHPGRCRVDLARWDAPSDTLVLVAAPDEAAAGPLWVAGGDGPAHRVRDAFRGPPRVAAFGDEIIVAESAAPSGGAEVMVVNPSTGMVSAAHRRAPNRAGLHVTGAHAAFTGLVDGLLVVGRIDRAAGAFEVTRVDLEGAIFTNPTLAPDGVLWFERRVRIPDGPFELWSVGDDGAGARHTQPLPVGTPLRVGDEGILVARPAADEVALWRLRGESMSPIDGARDFVFVANLMNLGADRGTGVDDEGWAWLLLQRGVEAGIARYRAGRLEDVVPATRLGVAVLGTEPDGAKLVHLAAPAIDRHQIVRIRGGRLDVVADGVRRVQQVRAAVGEGDPSSGRLWGWHALLDGDDGESSQRICPLDPARDGPCRQVAIPGDIAPAEDHPSLETHVSADGWITAAVWEGRGDTPVLVTRFPPPGDRDPG